MFSWKEINHEILYPQMAARAELSLVNLISLHQFSSVDGRELDYTQHQNYCFGPQRQEKLSPLNRLTMSLKKERTSNIKYRTLLSTEGSSVFVHSSEAFCSIANTLGSLISPFFSSTSPFPEDIIQSGSFLFYFTLKHWLWMYSMFTTSKATVTHELKDQHR